MQINNFQIRRLAQFSTEALSDLILGPMNELQIYENHKPYKFRNHFKCTDMKFKCKHLNQKH